MRRAPAFPIAWSPIKGAEVQLGADNGLGSRATESPRQPDRGHATLDTATLTAGIGTLYLVRTQRLVITHSGFHTCEVSSTASSVVPVVWI